MNPINFLKIKHLFFKYGSFITINSDSVDIGKQFDFDITTLSKLFPECYDIEKRIAEFPFKIGKIPILRVFNWNRINYIHLKSLKNFPSKCFQIEIDPSIIVDSLEGLGEIGTIKLAMNKEYETKEEVLKDCPNLKVRKLILVKHECIQFNHKKERVENVIDFGELN